MHDIYVCEWLCYYMISCCMPGWMDGKELASVRARAYALLVGQGPELEPTGPVVLGAVSAAHHPHRGGFHMGHLEYQGKIKLHSSKSQFRLGSTPFLLSNTKCIIQYLHTYIHGSSRTSFFF